MAMTLHLPDELDRAARTLAEWERRGVHDLVVDAVGEYVRRHGTDLEVARIAAEGARRYAEALDRLGTS